MPLEVIVIGAGIAGLTAAVSLIQAGHSVVIFEKSSFKTEVGAALNLMPNGAIVLQKIGFDFKRALVGRHQRLETVNGVTLDPLTLIDLSNIERDYGGHMQSVLRADLHAELLRLSKLGPNPAVLHLGQPVKSVNSSEGRVELMNGDIHTADLIVAADGSHTICRKEVLGYEQMPVESGKNAFRFLIPTDKIKNLDEVKALVPGRVPGATIFADVNDTQKTRHLAWYDCHGGAIQNFVGIYPAEQYSIEGVDHKTALLEQFQHFHPALVGMMELADDVKVWPLRFDDPLERYTRGRLVLIGDAAHTMLPFSGQGANQAIEGSGILGEIFQGVDPSDVPARVGEFESMRKNRIVLLKLLSRIRFGKENNAAYGQIKHEKLDNEGNDGSRPFPSKPPKEGANGILVKIPQSFHERLQFEWGYNVYEQLLGQLHVRQVASATS